MLYYFFYYASLCHISMLHNTHPYPNIPVLLALCFWYAGMALSFLSIVGDFHVLYMLTLTAVFSVLHYFLVLC